MIYLDSGATSYPKPETVKTAVRQALDRCANPGRGGYRAAMEAARTVYGCREVAGRLFDCAPEQVVLTGSCTHGLNIAIRTLVQPGSRVVISGFEHNAVTRPLHALGARITVAGRKLFDWDDTLKAWEQALRKGQDAAVFTHVSNVFGYVLPVGEMAALCRRYGVPFMIDAAQSAGSIPISFSKLGADFIAMPGHKGLLGPQGTGILLCAADPEPLLYGGTGSMSVQQTMPRDLPERLEAGTLNVPGIAGLSAGIRYVQKIGVEAIGTRERLQAVHCASQLEKLGMRVFQGRHQSGVVSFVPNCDCEEYAAAMADRGIALRAGLHCAPLAHESTGTLDTGTVRLSFGYTACIRQSREFLRAAAEIAAGSV